MPENENTSLPDEQHLASTWYGSDLEHRTNEWIIQLTLEEIEELEQATELLLTSKQNIASMTAKQFPLPTLGPKLVALSRELIHGLGFFILRGLPIEKYDEHKAGTMFYGLGCYLGAPRPQNAMGHVLGHIRDLGLKSSDPNVRIYQTNERQTFHTDSSDAVGLLCLKRAKSGGTSLVVSASAVFNEMRAQRPDLLELLMQPIATDRRSEVPEGMLPYVLIPVFSFYEGYLTVFYQRQYIESAQRFEDAPRLTHKHVEALDMFDRLVNDPKLHLSMELVPGDMQFVYNHALLHDRTAFEDWDDPKQKRHLLRLWLSLPDDRPLPDVFATRFGRTTIGDRGGIFVRGTTPTIKWIFEKTHDTMSMDNKEFFPDIKPIKYNPQASDDELLVFKHYNQDEIIMGKPMHEWLRFSVCFWHTFRGLGSDMFGSPTFDRPWDQLSDPMVVAKNRLRAAFEFFSKLGIKYYTFHDRDIAPEGNTIEETERNLDEIVQYAKELQKQTGIKCLWGTANLFSNRRYMNGAATNPDAHVFAYAAAQVKKAMEVTHELGGENYVFWGGREGYMSLLNTNVRKELDHLATFLRMAVEHKKRIGFKGQLLIEPKPKEPTKHQYDYDAQTVIGFLRYYNLDKDFKLNIEPNHTTLAGHAYEHDVEMCSRYGMLGSIDSNTGDQSLGWDTDQFPMNLRDCAFVMRTVLTQGGLAPGGLNFDCKVRRESTNLQDMFIAHIGAMDCFALALRKMAHLFEEKKFDALVEQRYASYNQTDIGRKIDNGTATFEELHQFIKQHGEPATSSGEQEKYEVIFNRYLH